jgi:hypothetical protein
MRVVWSGQSSAESRSDIIGGPKILTLDSRPLTLDPHTIRLRGPWQLQAVARFVARADGHYEVVRDDLPTSTRATMPADWSESFGLRFLGRVRYVRTFQKPTGLDAGERVWLVVEPPRSQVTARLAERTLGSVQANGPAGRFDITSLLADRNMLEIVVEHPMLDEQGHPTDAAAIGLPGGLIGDVRLEIEAAV